MNSDVVFTSRQRRILVARAGKLTASSTPGERALMIDAINEELDRIGLKWGEVFERGLPMPNDAPTKPFKPDLASAMGDMMQGFAGFTHADPDREKPRRPRLQDDEIPSAVAGTLTILDTTDWKGDPMVVVDVNGDQYTYGPLGVVDEASRIVVLNAGGRRIAGRVRRPTRRDEIHELHGVMVE